MIWGIEPQTLLTPLPLSFLLHSPTLPLVLPFPPFLTLRHPPSLPFSVLSLGSLLLLPLSIKPSQVGWFGIFARLATFNLDTLTALTIFGWFHRRFELEIGELTIQSDLDFKFW